MRGFTDEIQEKIRVFRSSIRDGDKFVVLELDTKKAFKNALLTKIAFLTYPLALAEFEARIALDETETTTRSQLMTEKNEPLRPQTVTMEQVERVFINREESRNLLWLSLMQLSLQEPANRHSIEISKLVEGETITRDFMVSTFQATLFSFYDERDGFDDLQSPIKTPKTFEPAPPGL